MLTLDNIKTIVDEMFGSFLKTTWTIDAQLNILSYDSNSLALMTLREDKNDIVVSTFIKYDRIPKEQFITYLRGFAHAIQAEREIF